MGRGRTILVVEDEEHLLRPVAFALGERGWRVLTAVDGAEALAHLLSGAEIDAVFVDISLPGRVKGWEIVDEFRRIFRHGAVVYASGYPINEAPVAGSEFFNKPYQVGEVLDCLDRLTAAGPRLAGARAPR